MLCLQVGSITGRVKQKMCDTKVLQGALADHCELLGKCFGSSSLKTTKFPSIVIVHYLNCSSCACTYVTCVHSVRC